MGKILVIAEKPSVGRDIARVLKCSGKAEGFLYSESYMVSWAIGHLATLGEPEDYDDTYKKWRLNDLPIIPQEMKLKPIQKTKKQLNVLKKLMNDPSVDSIVCATDSGREGELIFRYIYAITKCKKVFKRLWISSMTDSAILEGFKNLKDGREYDLLYLSAKCRSEADWLVGINATRAYTLRYNTLLSIGRVQTPTLAILVERQKEIKVFVPVPYWEISAKFEGYTGLWYDEAARDTKIMKIETARSIAEKVSGKTGILEKIEKEEKRQPHPLLYDLTELQRDCNKRYGYPAQKTLDLAQALYEKRKLITYPRTDSRYLSEDLKPKLKPIISLFSKVEPYAEYANYILNLSKLPITKRIVDNSKITDHHAIIPTNLVPNINSLSKEEFNVYDSIVRRFLSVFYPNYIFCITKMITAVQTEDSIVKFLTKGTTVMQLGWMELYKNQKNNNEEVTLLPKIEKGSQINLLQTKILSKKTQPPKAYTEGTLLSAMENAGRFVDDENLKEQMKEYGLGTPATRAATIERLLQVGYIERKAKTIIPTEKGMSIIEIVPKELKSPETTGKWEKGLTSISKGKMDTSKFMASIARYVHYIIAESGKVVPDITFPKTDNSGSAQKKNSSYQVHIGVCPKCGNGQILENSKSFYCSKWKYGCKFTVWKNTLDRYGQSVTSELIVKLLQDKKINDISVTLPQTGEKCKADLILKHDLSGVLELINLKRRVSSLVDKKDEYEPQ